MATDRERDLSNVLNKVEQDMTSMPMPTSSQRPPSTVADFAPPKYKQGGDTLVVIHQDFKKAIADMETRLRAYIEEIKRLTN